MRRTRREEVRKLLRNFLNLFNGPRVEIKLSKFRLIVRLTHALLRVGAGKRTRIYGWLSLLRD